MKRTAWAMGWAVMAAVLSGCGGGPPETTAEELECMQQAAEAMSAPGTSAMVPPMDPLVDGEPSERVDLGLETGAGSEENAIALCNDPPSGEMRVVQNANGGYRCAFGLRPLPDDFAVTRCEAIEEAARD